MLNRAFAKQLRIPDRLSKAPSLPNYLKEGDDWPTVPGSNVRCMRFAWDSVHSLVNQENITKIMEYVRAHGAELVPEAGSLRPQRTHHQESQISHFAAERPRESERDHEYFSAGEAQRTG